ncbi:MAG: hypothetical protein O6939_03700 [Bacteroidetes bacterium]|nr:hypothetical protein [Bacteroidota bacterium]MCZ6898957.1 hypothetical protein [Bacteroidota bacterium]
MRTFIVFLGVIVAVLLLGAYSSLAQTTDADAVTKKERTQVIKIKEGDDISSIMGPMCQKSCGAMNYDPSEVKSQAHAKIGDLTKCLVSRVVFRVTENSPRVSYQDQKFYTCCGSCTKLFDADPEKFVEQS